MQNARRQTRRGPLRLNAILHAAGLAAVVLTIVGCPSQPVPAGQPAPPPAPATTLPRTGPLRPASPDTVTKVDLQPTVNIPVGTPTVQCLVEVAQAASVQRPIVIQVRNLKGRRVVDTISGTFIPAHGTSKTIPLSNLHAFGTVGDYAIEAEVRGHRRAGFMRVYQPGPTPFRIAQDIPASVTPSASPLAVGATTAAANVRLVGTMASTSVVVTYFDMANNSPLSPNTTFPATNGAGSGPITGQPLEAPRDVEMVATSGTSQGSASGSFTVQ